MKPQQAFPTTFQAPQLCSDLLSFTLTPQTSKHWLRTLLPRIISEANKITRKLCYPEAVSMIIKVLLI